MGKSVNEDPASESYEWFHKEIERLRTQMISANKTKVQKLGNQMTSLDTPGQWN